MTTIEHPHTVPLTARSGVNHGSPRLVLIGPLPPPYIGPAVATRRLLKSRAIRSRFTVVFVDTSDRDGLDSMGRFDLNNVADAIRHGWVFLTSLHPKPDVVYVPISRGLWGFLRDLLFLVPARVRGSAVVVHLRAGRFDLVHDYGLLGRLLARIGLGCADVALVLGETVRDVFGSMVLQDRIRVVPNGLELGSWSFPARKRERPEALRVVCIANLFHDKGTHVLLDAVRLLRDQGIPAQVVFGGDWRSDDYRRSCLAFVEEHGIGELVRFAGRVNEAEKKQLLTDSDVAVFVPVLPEGQPWVVLEAMAASLPVIATAQGTIPEMVVDGETGFIVPTGDGAAVADALRVIATDEGLRQSMGAAGRCRLEERYTEECSHRMLADALAEAVRRRAATGQTHG